MLAVCVLTLYPRGDSSGWLSFLSKSACYSRAGTSRLAKIYMVLRSLYGLWPDIWFRVWEGRTSTELNFKVFQNINLSKTINYILQLAQNEVDGGLSHPRLCPAWPIRNPFPVNRATKEPPPQRTKRARRKSSGGASVDRERMQQQTGKGEGFSSANQSRSSSQKGG